MAMCHCNDPLNDRGDTKIGVKERLRLAPKYQPQIVKDHEELYDKTNEHFKDKARKICLWKTLFKSQRNCNEKLTQSKSGQASKK